MFRWWNFLPVLFCSDLYDWLNLVFIFILYFSRVPYDHKIHFNHVFIAIICVSILTVKKGNSILYFLCLLPFSASPLWCHWCLSQICSNKPQPGVDSLCLFPFRTRGRSNRSVLARGCKTEGWIFSSLDVFYFAEIQGEKNTFLKMGRIWKKKKNTLQHPQVTTRWHPFTYNLRFPHKVAVISFSDFRFPQCSLRFHGDRVSSGF